MLTVDDIAGLLGQPYKAGIIGSVLGTIGRESETGASEGHPDDERLYCLFPELGLQMLIEDGVISTIFCMIDGDEDIAPYDWSFKNGINGESSRDDVLLAFGKPESSGCVDGFVPYEWDRFKKERGTLHIQYRSGHIGISQITLCI